MTVDVESQVAAYARWVEGRAGAPMRRATATTLSTSTDETQAEDSSALLVDAGLGDRSEPHRLRWLAFAACVVLVFGGLLFLSGRSTPEPTVPANQPTDSPDVLAPKVSSTVVERGDDVATVTIGQDTSPQDATTIPARSHSVTRSVDPDGDDATTLRVTYQVPTNSTEWWPLGGGWGLGDGFGAYKYLPGEGVTALSITTMSNLVSDACRDHAPLDPPVGPTVDDLVTALSQLAPFEVTASPTDVTLFGYHGKHLELTVPAMTVTSGVSKNDAKFTDCVEGELHSWISPLNVLGGSSALLAHSSDSLGAFNAYQKIGQTEEFWVLDVEGTRLVIVSFNTPGAPPDDIAERDAMSESIHIEP